MWEGGLTDVKPRTKLAPSAAQDAAMTRMLLVGALLLMALAGPVASQGRTLLKCVMPDGSIAFQQTDCPKEADATRLQVPDAEIEPQRVGMQHVQSVAAEFPEILETPEATAAVIARRDELIATGMSPDHALSLAAAEYSARARASAQHTDRAAPQPQREQATQADRVAESAQDPMDQLSDMVMCTEPGGKSYMVRGACPPTTTRYQMQMMTTLNPQTGQTGQALVNVPHQRPVQQSPLTKREACVQSGVESGNSTYEKAKHRAQGGSPSGPCN